jgi:hypothetical protein
MSDALENKDREDCSCSDSLALLMFISLPWPH